MDHINLNIGDPADLPPSCLVERASKAILERDASHYPLPHSGHIGTKEAACQYYAKQHGVAVAPTQVCITPGALPGLTYAILAAKCERQVCGVFAPYFPAFRAAVTAAGYQFHQISIPEGSLTKAMLGVMLAPIMGGLLLLNNPNNPTGRVFSANELIMIDTVTRRYGIRVVCDAVYIDIYEGPESPMSYLQVAPDAVEVISLSKTFRAPGYRIGAVVGDKDWVKRVVQSTLVFNGIPPVFQKVAQMAWSSMPEVGTFRREIADRRAHLITRLRDQGFEIDTKMRNQSGIFVWARLPDRWETAQSFVAFASDRRVQVACGDDFGMGGARHVRWALNFGAERIDEALAHLSLLRPTSVKTAQNIRIG